ncbi:MAG: MoaD/ThiS family protein [Candidatus Bathyarchaeia archaeon]
MRVKVQYLGLIRSKMGKREEEVDVKEGASLSDLLNKLTKTYGESLKSLFDEDEENILDPSFVVTVNGVLAGQLHGMKTRLKRGDRIALMTLISGG